MNKILLIFSDLTTSLCSCSTRPQGNSIKVSKSIHSHLIESKIKTKRSQDWNRAIFEFNQNLMKLDTLWHIQKCAVSMENYHSHLSPPLPQSAVLWIQWSKKEREHRTDCNEAIQKLIEVHQMYDEDPRVKISKTLIPQIEKVKTKYRTLSKLANQIISEIPQRITEWEIFKHTLDKYSKWLDGAHAKLKRITCFHRFLTDFQPVLDTFKEIETESKEKSEDFQYLLNNCQKHLLSTEMKERKEHVDKEEEVMKVKEDPETLQYRTRFSIVTEQWKQFSEKMNSFCADKKPWKKMVDDCNELSYWKDEITHEVEGVVETERKLERLVRNVGPVTERYKYLLNKVISRDDSLQQLHMSIETYLTQDLRQNHKDVDEFVCHCEKLTNEWEELKLQLENRHDSSVHKMKEWERYSSKCIQRVPVLENEIKQLKTKMEQLSPIQHCPTMTTITKKFLSTSFPS